MLDKAVLFAIERHGDQKYDGKPYVFHLEQVADVLREFGYDYNGDMLIVAAYLHDILEDTDTTEAELQNKFGWSVKDTVFAVTGIGKTREERTQNTLDKLDKNPQAIVLKMADRLANMRYSAKNSRRLNDRYIDELPKYGKYFYGPMYEEMKSFKKVPE